MAVCDFKFNAWAKYDNSGVDDALPGVVADYLEVKRFVAYGENDLEDAGGGGGDGGGEYQR